MLTEKNLQTFANLQRLALESAKRRYPNDTKLHQDIENARTATWKLQEGSWYGSLVVGDDYGFGIYIGTNHNLYQVSGPIWINLTK